jgi:hypothetical protein
MAYPLPFFTCNRCNRCNLVDFIEQNRLHMIFFRCNRCNLVDFIEQNRLHMIFFRCNRCNLVDFIEQNRLHMIFFRVTGVTRSKLRRVNRVNAREAPIDFFWFRLPAVTPHRQSAAVDKDS